MRAVRKLLLTHFLFVVLSGLLNYGQQAVCKEATAYPVLDSKIPVDERTRPFWLSNSQVLFNGYDLDATRRQGAATVDEVPRGAYVWDLKKGMPERDHTWDGTSNWCVSGDFRSYLRLRQGTENTFDLVQGKVGDEQFQAYREKRWFNPISCRYYFSVPYWITEGQQNRSIPLLEKHGYLDFGVPSRADPSKASPIVLYMPSKKKSLPLTGEQVETHVTYFEFADKYLLKEEQRTSDAVAVWSLDPEGVIRKILEPTGKSWERIGWGGIHLTKRGLFLVGGRAGYDTVGTAGGYLLAGEKPMKLIAGLVWNESVSPDGCKIAFVHVLHSQAGAESAKALREGNPGTRTLKMIDLCGEKGE